MLTLSLVDWIAIFFVAFLACLAALLIGVSIGFFRDGRKVSDDAPIRVKSEGVVRPRSSSKDTSRFDVSTKAGDRERAVRVQGLTGAEWEAVSASDVSREVSLDDSFTREIEISRPIGDPAAGGAIIPVPGWYRDPHGGSFLRYWDGGRWTESVAPLQG